MISLVDFLKFSGIPLHNWKIHLATSTKNPPLEAFYQGKFKEWQEEQNNKNFHVGGMVVGLIYIHSDQWLFGGVYKILGITRGTNTKYRYNSELIPGQEDLVGRIIVNYKREFRASYIYGSKYGHLLEISEIKPQKIMVEAFPGYNRVIISHSRLQTIINQNEPTWRSALSNVKGVYAISDTVNGRLYIGSATGNEGIWQRWIDYAKTGHGGNKEIKKLLNRKGDKYIGNFQYTILEIADWHATDDDITRREQHWKKALLSKEKGLNRN